MHPTLPRVDFRNFSRANTFAKHCNFLAPPPATMIRKAFVMSVNEGKPRLPSPDSPVFQQQHTLLIGPLARKRLPAFFTSTCTGAEQEYEQRHSPIWEELERVLKEHGVSNYSIFLHPGSSRLQPPRVFASTRPQQLSICAHHCTLVRNSSAVRLR